MLIFWICSYIISSLCGSSSLNTTWILQVTHHILCVYSCYRKDLVLFNKKHKKKKKKINYEVEI